MIMTEKKKADLMKDAGAVVKTIQSQLMADVIKDYLITPLVNMKTGKDVGFAVQLELHTRYDYGEFLLTQWKKMLQADEWYFSARRCQLHVTFKVRYKED